jgi:O-antigen biosynthesis protein
MNPEPNRQHEPGTREPGTLNSSVDIGGPALATTYVGHPASDAERQHAGVGSDPDPADLVVELQAGVVHLARLVHAQDQELTALRQQLDSCHGSLTWRLRVRAAAVQTRISRVPLLRETYLIARRAIDVWLTEGVGGMLRKSGNKAALAIRGRPFLVEPGRRPAAGSYEAWLARSRAAQPDAATLHAALAQLRSAPLVSVLAVLPSQDVSMLRHLLATLRAQVYARWELCVAVTGRAPDLVSGECGPVRVVECVHGSASYRDAFLASCGDVIALLEVGDELAPDALFEIVSRFDRDDTDIVYSDEDLMTAGGERRQPFFKPDWSPDLLLSMSWMDALVAFRRTAIEQAGGFSAEFGMGQVHDLLLRVSEATSAIAHVPKVLYHRRVAEPTAEAMLARYQAGREERLAIERALCRRGYNGSAHGVFTRWGPRAYRTRLEVKGTPLVSIVMPTRDKPDLLRAAIDSIRRHTGYRHYEIIVVDNGSADPAAVAYLDSLGPPCRVFRWPGEFNYSAINNFGVEQARGDQILFLNNDVEVVQPDWLAALLEHAQCPGVGAVGAKLLYPDGRIQHAGVLVGVHGPVVHAFRGWSESAIEHPRLSDAVRNCSGVTGACMMVPRAVFEQVGGFDPELRVAFNDIDLCLRMREQGYRIVYTPHAVLTHVESASRGDGDSYPETDRVRFESRWATVLDGGDPYHNHNLAGMHGDWALPAPS